MTNPELIKRITKAVRLADIQFETTGGSSRHWVRECLLPALEDEGLEIGPREADRAIHSVGQ